MFVYSKLISKDDQFMNDKWNAGTRFLPSCIQYQLWCTSYWRSMDAPWGS